MHQFDDFFPGRARLRTSLRDSRLLTLNAHYQRPFVISKLPYPPMINSACFSSFAMNIHIFKQFFNWNLISLKCTKLHHFFPAQHAPVPPYRLATSDTQCALSVAFLWLKNHGWTRPREYLKKLPVFFVVAMYINILKLSKFNWKHFKMHQIAFFPPVEHAPNPRK